MCPTTLILVQCDRDNEISHKTSDLRWSRRILRNRLLKCVLLEKIGYASYSVKTCKMCNRHRTHYKASCLSCLRDILKTGIFLSYWTKFHTRHTRLKPAKYAADIEIKKLNFQVIHNGKIPYALYKAKTCSRDQQACTKVNWNGTYSFNLLRAIGHIRQWLDPRTVACLLLSSSPLISRFRPPAPPFLHSVAKFLFPRR